MNEPLKILVVDDEDSLRMSLASILELEGYDVKMAEDGYKAIEIAKQEDIDIVFSDIRMPGLTGNEAFKEIKKIKPDVVGVMMTAYALNDLIVDSLNNGAFTCLSKPFEIDVILATIKDIVERPFAVVIDKDTQANLKFVNSLKNCGLNVTSCTIDKIDFIAKHKPDILIMDANADKERSLEGLKKIKEILGNIPETILVTNKENTAFLEEAKNLGVKNFINHPIDISQVFEILDKDKRKINVAMIDDDSEEFKNLKSALIEKGFHILTYSSYEKLIDELKDSFFDVILIDDKIETNIFDIEEKIRKVLPNIGVAYILNDDKNAETVKQKGFFYINKPFEIEDIVNLINKILGK